MGHIDKWTTPKQKKIEREGEPKELRRGAFKHRIKGKKARLDEIRAMKKRLENWEEIGSRYCGGIRPIVNKLINEYRNKYHSLIQKAIEDGVI